MKAADRLARSRVQHVRQPELQGQAPEIAASYMLEGNAWFERVASVSARWNRTIFYDGSLFHSANLRTPERLHADPPRAG